MKLRFPACFGVFVLLTVARLAAAAGDDATALAVGRAYLKYQAALRAALPKAEADADAQWWKSTSPVLPGAAEMSAKFSTAEREFRDAVRAATGNAVIPASGPNPRLAFLPQEKQDAVARIEQTYSERMSEVRRKAGNLGLASDTERMKGMMADRDKDLAAVLTPAELEQFQLRTSTSSLQLRSRYGEAIESLDEFKQLFALQKAFDEKYSPELIVMNSNLLRTRMDDERKMFEQMLATLGPARAATFRRAADQEYTTLKTLARRLNLPDNVPDTVMDLRENYAGVSQAINNQAGINSMDRRSLIQDVEKEARQKLIDLLGKEGFEAYSPRNNWLRYLENGQAFGTDPKDAPPGLSISASTGVFPIYPPGTVIRTSPSGGSVISSGPSTPPPWVQTATGAAAPASRPSNASQSTPAVSPAPTKK